MEGRPTIATSPNDPLPTAGGHGYQPGSKGQIVRMISR